MTTAFDASLVYTGPIGDDVLAAQRHEVERAMSMLSALANAKLHATREMERWVLACNRLVWGEMPAELRPPSPEDIASVLAHLGPENGERLLKEAKLAAEQRNLVALLSEAETAAHAQLEAQRVEEERAEAEERARFEAAQAEMARAETEQALWREFEAIDEAGKQARFQAWRAGRRS